MVSSSVVGVHREEMRTSGDRCIGNLFIFTALWCLRGKHSELQC